MLYYFLLFIVLKKSIKQLENPIEVNKCKDAYTEARARLSIVVCLIAFICISICHQMSEKRRKAKKDTGSDAIEEDKPEIYKKQVINYLSTFCYNS